MEDLLEGGPIRLIARLMRSEPLQSEDLIIPNANRWSFEFDCIDAELGDEEAQRLIRGEGRKEALRLLRVLTTKDNFIQIADLENTADGHWFHIELVPRGKLSGPFAWASPLGDSGYKEIFPLALKEIRHLFYDGDVPVRPLGAESDDLYQRAQSIADASRFPELAKDGEAKARKLLARLLPPRRIVVRDVGQASFCSAFDKKGDEVFHLDAGWPISFNEKTASRKPRLKAKSAPVILSHWDWDHLHGYHVVDGLASSTWIVPVQKLGPGAARVAHALARKKRLLGLQNAMLSVGPFKIGTCAGKPGNLNQTGLCVEVKLSSGRCVLYVGDADYYLAPENITSTPDHLVVTHHGAEFRGSVVAPSSHPGACVVSVGKGNTYRHPTESALAAHMGAGWIPRFTCSRNGVGRGSHTLD